MDAITEAMISAGRTQYRARQAARYAAQVQIRSMGTGGRASEGMEWEAEAAARCRRRTLKAARRAAHQVQRLQLRGFSV